MKTYFYLFKDFLEAASYFFVVVGVGYAAFEYYQSQSDQRRTLAIEYLGKFHEEKMVDARISLLAPWLDYPLAALSGSTGSREAINTLSLSFVFPDEGSGNLDALIRVVDYLDLLGECVSNDICDPQVTQAQVSEYASDLACLYIAPLKILREKKALTTLGNGTAILTDGRCKY